jgi:hypothetical protein
VVPKLAILVETDSPINTMLKWGGWCQTTYFDQEKRYIYTYEKFTKKV